MRLILGSKSPRRRELLAGIDIPFKSVLIKSDESYPSELQAGEIPIFISQMKARAYTKPLAEDEVLITADTIVWLDGEMLGKPKDEADARRMLRLLSGKTHQVYTAVTFRVSPSSFYKKKDKELHSFVCQSDVTFRQLTDDEISYYVRTYRPLDKAGAYGIQEWIGFIGVTGIQGSYFNVMGFPIQRVYSYLKSIE